MKIVYSDHARRRMKQRGIEEWEVEHILKHPHYIKKSFDEKREAVGELRNRYIKIVFLKEENYIKVITVI